MPGVLRRMLLSWDVMLGIIPFIVLLGYAFHSIASSAQGAAAKTVSGFIAKDIGMFIVSMIVFCGIAGALAWFDERRRR